jgi:hypothetical protein
VLFQLTSSTPVGHRRRASSISSILHSLETWWFKYEAAVRYTDMELQSTDYFDPIPDGHAQQQYDIPSASTIITEYLISSCSDLFVPTPRPLSLFSFLFRSVILKVKFAISAYSCAEIQDVVDPLFAAVGLNVLYCFLYLNSTLRTTHMFRFNWCLSLALSVRNYSATSRESSLECIFLINCS